MIFQPYSTGFMITTVESVLFAGKRRPPTWLAFLTLLATGLVLVGGILLLILLKNSSGSTDISEQFLGIVALLVTIMFPMNLVLRYYLRLENPITIHRSSILEIQRNGSTLMLLATLRNGTRPVRFVINTRSQEEAGNIEHNLTVHAHGRLRCYPITFLPDAPSSVNFPTQWNLSMRQ